MRYQVNFDRDRIEEAKQRRSAHYRGEQVDRIPFIYSVPASVSNGWINGNPYSFSEMLQDPTKVVEGQVMAFRHQCESFPDCDYIPMFQTFMYGEGFIPSLLGAKQLDGGEMPPFQDGRIMSSIYDVDKLPERIDPSLGYGPLAKEAFCRMAEAFDGYVPICVTDHQSPYGMATKLMDNEALMLAMYDEPELVKKLLKYCTQAIKDTIDLLYSWVGKENVALNPTLPIPGEGGIILWDDYISVINPNLHTEFCKPFNMDLYETYGRGHLHTCGPYFNGYIDAVLECDPISIDVGIMRGMGRTREDMLLLKQIADEHNIILCSGITAINESVFEKSGVVEGDREFFLKMATGRNIVFSDGGSREKGLEIKEWVGLV